MEPCEQNIHADRVRHAQTACSITRILSSNNTGRSSRQTSRTPIGQVFTDCAMGRGVRPILSNPGPPRGSETSEYFLQRPRNERGGSQQDPECSWSAWSSPNHGEEEETQMVSGSSGMANIILQGTVKGEEGEEDRRCTCNTRLILWKAIYGTVCFDIHPRHILVSM